jgi:dTDP-glucose pyrophosphorylase/CBS domain-containing protein
MFTKDLRRICISPDTTILESARTMERNRFGLCLVVDNQDCLIGTVNDGDVRRAILNESPLGDAVSRLLDWKKGTPYEKPTVAPIGRTNEHYLMVLRKESMVHLPLVDEEGKLKDLVRMIDLVPDRTLPVQAVIMAGGKGTRMMPLTEDLPKPMLPLGERPLLELIVGKLRSAGIARVNVTTHYKPDTIQGHFGDGADFGVELNYVSEKSPLGTAGALNLLEASDEPILVVNGDILTDVDFQSMLAYHHEHRADMTIAVREFDFEVPYGVVKTQGSRVIALEEKPSLSFFVNAGMYLLEPEMCRYIPEGKAFDMTDLIQMLLHNGKSIVSFPVYEYWIDIGQVSDYEKARRDVSSGDAQT